MDYSYCTVPKKKTFDLCLAIKRQSGPLLIEESEEEQVPRQSFI